MADACRQPSIEERSTDESILATNSGVGPASLTQETAEPVQRVFPIRLTVGKDPFEKPSNGLHLDLTPREPTVLEHSKIIENATVVPSDKTKDSVKVSIQDHSAPEFSDLCGDSPSIFAPAVSEHITASGTHYITNQFSFGASKGNPLAPGVVRDEHIYRCEDEPIHIPGAIQRFGALVAIRVDERGHFVVRMASENTESVIGLSPEHLFSLQSFTDALNAQEKAEFIIRVHALQSSASRTDPDVYALSMISAQGIPIPLFCAVHLNTASDLIVCEFEFKKDVFNPRHPPDDGFPDVPIKVIDQQKSTPEAHLRSTTSQSDPLHAVAIARKSARELGSMDLFHILAEIQKQMTAAPDLQSLLDTLVGLVYELTSFHRVMVYQFDDTAAGCVQSEIVDSRASTDIYRGLHFPASDIPQQARDLYLVNTIRILYDREQETARLVCRTLEDTSPPLDLKHSYLRAMSPIHLRYLSNIGVRASMSISLVDDGKLWGLIACHNYGSSNRVSLPVRELCRGLGNIASTNICRLILAARIKARKILSVSPPKISPSVYIAASSADLLGMFAADFGFLVIKGEARTIGRLSAYEEAIALLQYIREMNFSDVFSTDAIHEDCLDFKYPKKLALISGMLVIPLNAMNLDFLVFFRKGVLKEINWAGNPYEKVVAPGRNYLDPRASFQRWSERVVGTSREWTEDQIESARVLMTIYGRFIEVWRQKEAIVQKNRMTRLLIHNAGHEVRTPLSSIINYLEVALEDRLDERARLHLERSLQASKSLVFVVNDLLNLTEVEDSLYNVHQDYIDLKAIIRTIITAFQTESSRKGLEVVLEADETIPSFVKSDPTSLRQVVSNLLANSIQHSEKGKIVIGLRCIKTLDNYVEIEIYIEDQGKGLLESQIDSIFRDFEKILDDEDASDETTTTTNDAKFLATENTEIGLGLAITARFVRLNNGQITMSSAGPGKGTKVSITIPFHKAAIQPKFPPPLAPALELLPTPPTLSDAVTSIRTSFFNPPLSSSNGVTSAPLFKSPEIPETPSLPSSPISEFTHSEFDKMNILIAEDNPLNSRLLQTRLSRKGHGVQVAVDGQTCANAFKLNPELFDIILMDIQMPLVDGIESTRLIRLHELTTPCLPLSPKVRAYGRMPIIAVSASLVEKNQKEYVAAGFDGWITKPIDFKRLERIIDAIGNVGKRKGLEYGRCGSGWEEGGWFVC